MNGKIVGIGLVVTALVAGAVIWWLQVYAFFSPVVFGPGNEIQLTPIGGGAPEAIIAEAPEGIDAESSPLRFRACFTTPLSLTLLRESYETYPEPTPTIGPRWFDCYDAGAVDAGLESGEAVAFLSERDIVPGVDRVVAVFGDGRAYVWHQLNDKLKD